MNPSTDPAWRDSSGLAPRSRPALRWLLGGALVLALSLYALYPGWLSFDAATQLWQARTGHYRDLQPPISAALWALLLDLGAPPGALLVLHLAALVAGLVLIAESLRPSRWWVGAGVIALPLWPPFLLMLGHLWSDVGLAAALVLGFGLALQARQRGSRTLALLALLPLAYAAAVRYNAALAVVPPVALLIAGPLSNGLARAARAAATAAVVAAMALAGFVVNRALTAEHVPAWTPTAIWDLAAVSVARNEMLLPEGVRGPGLDVAQLAAVLSPDQALPLLVGTRSGIRAGILKPLPDDVRRELLARWLALPLHAPGPYLAHRAAVAWSQFGPQRADKPMALFMTPEAVPFADNPPLALNQTRLNQLLVEGMRALRTTVVATPLAYLLLGSLAGLFLSRRPATAARSLALVLLASGALYAAPLLVIVPSAEWRYGFWPMFACALAALVAVADSGRTRRAIAARDRPHAATE